MPNRITDMELLALMAVTSRDAATREEARKAIAVLRSIAAPHDMDAEERAYALRNGWVDTPGAGW